VSRFPNALKALHPAGRFRFFSTFSENKAAAVPKRFYRGGETSKNTPEGGVQQQRKLFFCAVQKPIDHASHSSSGCDVFGTQLQATPQRLSIRRGLVRKNIPAHQEADYQ
jgi:hypothetical protein